VTQDLICPPNSIFTFSPGAAQPQILTPQFFGQAPIEGFADEESGRFMNWLKENHPEMRLLKYGFSISKQDIHDTLLHENMETVAGNVLEEVKRNENYGAVLLGVEQPWEVCLLKFTADVIKRSAGSNLEDWQKRGLL
jgi:hypothetical protein